MALDLLTGLAFKDQFVLCLAILEGFSGSTCFSYLAFHLLCMDGCAAYLEKSCHSSRLISKCISDF